MNTITTKRSRSFQKLRRSFFERPADSVARELIGKILVRRLPGKELRARVVETEAYLGPRDLASHASKGRTRRTEILFGPAGHAYVYLIYGMYEMLNIVAGPPGGAQAVLIRGAQPLDGWQADLSGPGRLTRAWHHRLGKRSGSDRMPTILLGRSQLQAAAGFCETDRHRLREGMEGRPTSFSRCRSGRTRAPPRSQDSFYGTAPQDLTVDSLAGSWLPRMRPTAGSLRSPLISIDQRFFVDIRCRTSKMAGISAYTYYSQRTERGGAIPGGEMDAEKTRILFFLP